VQVRRHLSLLGRHQHAIGADHVIFRADANVLIVVGANNLAAPMENCCFVARSYFRRAGQCAVDRHDLVVEDVRGGLVLVDPLLDDSLVVAAQITVSRYRLRSKSGSWRLRIQGIREQQR